MISNNISDYIPTLSTDDLKSLFVIQVSEELSKIWEEKHLNWWKVLPKGEEYSNKVFYENLDWYNKNIASVYLPHQISIMVEEPNRTLEDLNRELWDCDYSYYKATEVKGRIVTLKLTEA